ncbi:hypothetical protein PR048_033512 [Dryococelus australis]|uniref:Uncharacterized protein n=1 Tax=Dryococelus australis TaxID=614101 RepID=A0ABQ9G0H3_9NEOP|nr:hypothetical protein PR048_033512 [Dryococelus australis]
MEQRWNARVWKTGYPRENPLTTGFVWHHSSCAKIRDARALATKPSAAPNRHLTTPMTPCLRLHTSQATALAPSSAGYRSTWSYFSPPAFDTENRGIDKGDTATRIKCCIADKRGSIEIDFTRRKLQAKLALYGVLILRLCPNSPEVHTYAYMSPEATSGEKSKILRSPVGCRDGVVVRLLVSYLGETGFVRGNRAGRRRWSSGFPRGSPVFLRPRIPALLHTHRRFALIGSQDLDYSLELLEVYAGVGGGDLLGFDDLGLLHPFVALREGHVLAVRLGVAELGEGAELRLEGGRRRLLGARGARSGGRRGAVAALAARRVLGVVRLLRLVIVIVLVLDRRLHRFSALRHPKHSVNNHQYHLTPHTLNKGRCDFSQPVDTTANLPVPLAPPSPSPVQRQRNTPPCLACCGLQPHAIAVMKGRRETGYPRENPPTNGMVRHDSHTRKSGDPARDRTRIALVGDELSIGYSRAHLIVNCLLPHIQSMASPSVGGLKVRTSEQPNGLTHLGPVAPSWFETRSEIASKIDTENCCLIRVQSWTGDRDEVRFEPPKSAAIVDKCSLKIRQQIELCSIVFLESEIQNHEISLVQHFYIGIKIKLDPVSELGSFDLGSGRYWCNWP